MPFSFFTPGLYINILILLFIPLSCHSLCLSLDRSIAASGTPPFSSSPSPGCLLGGNPRAMESSDMVPSSPGPFAPLLCSQQAQASAITM
uniref:Uncharacterized protein n=1 Tax=Physcomitrium patens TaxID=3218 RepID=A0A2K1L2M0_PHYPA|nr:hypothetical protein PHYPA_003067 [Physcomitrium patens]